ncbi:MAG TPA: glycosyltransferase family 2 protein [Opitutaceae bacterium]|nr:glycosyltransferase family 2 protein [Opitutaceae bacterium]
MNPLRAAFIIPVHNRRETTLACLRLLAADGVPAWAEIYVVDDGSSDGTGAAVQAAFPAVHVLTGTGQWWWTGATEQGMRAAYADGAEFIFWLNDDTTPRPGACARLLATAEATGAVVTGQCFVPPDGPLVYGGLRRHGVGLRMIEIAGDEPAEVDAACGNFVCLPRAVVSGIGFPDGRHLPHAHGDTDYTLRARAAGHRVLVEPRAGAEARPNALRNYASWLLSEITVGQIWRSLGQQRSYAYAPAHARWLMRHFGLRGAGYWLWTVAKRVPISLARLTVPQSWLRRAWGARSRAWQEEQRLLAALKKSRASS